MRPIGAHPDHEVTDPGCCWVLSIHVFPAHAKLRQVFFQPVGVIRLGFRRTRDGIQRAASIGQAVRLPAHLDHSLQLQRIEQVELRSRLLTHDPCQVHFRTIAAPTMMSPHPLQALDLFVDDTIRDAPRLR